jgi:hypothetical protein
VPDITSSGEEARRPHLSPAPVASELLGLHEEARRLWTDVAERRRAMQAIAEAMAGDVAALERAVQRVDTAVVDGLRALGLPRGPVRQVSLDASLDVIAPSGKKQPDCMLVINGNLLEALLSDRRGPDTTFRTWVHESIHARQPFGIGHESEYRRRRGYEEGLAEGLARLVARAKAGMNPRESSYQYYVSGYRTLGRAFDIEPERLWRRIWIRPLGQVRASFVHVVDELRYEGTGERFTAAQRACLLAVADQVFDSDRANRTGDEDAMMPLWETVTR